MNSPVVPFTKATACGNDFVIIDAAHAPVDLAAFTRNICDRHNGVGADGVEWLFPDQGADIHARLFNADGSEAEISGNGTRCVAAYLASQQNAKDVFRIRTGAGLKTCTLISRSGRQYQFETDMGKPEIADRLSITVGSGQVTGLRLSLGNPHFVVFVEAFDPGWQTGAAQIGKDRHFQHGTNVELVVVRDPGNIEVRFLERGVGETQSSGTGSCAAAVASIHAGKAASPVKVHAPGGVQTVRWDGNLFLRGPAELVCRGEFYL